MLRTFIISALFLALGALGGWIFAFFPVPLPHMLGSMAASALAVAFLPSIITQDFKPPVHLRTPFIASIGLLIGAQVHLETLSSWQPIAIIALIVTLFTPIAHWLNYRFMQRFGGYDVPTAFFCAAPGGLIEALTLGERAGAKAAILTVQQFLRIVLVVMLIPLLMSIWVGHPVGSAAGLSQFSHAASSPLWQIVAAGAAAELVDHPRTDRHWHDTWVTLQRVKRRDCAAGFDPCAWFCSNDACTWGRVGPPHHFARRCELQCRLAKPRSRRCQ